MPDADQISAAVLVAEVRVEPEQRNVSKQTAVQIQQVALVRAILLRSEGREIEGPYGDACLTFGAWQPAVRTALALGSSLSRLPVELGRIEVRIGLALSPVDADEAPIKRAAQIAGLVDADEIGLDEGLATLVQTDLPDRMSVTPIRSRSGMVSPGFQRLTLARGQISHAVPQPVSSFVGRGDEIDAVSTLIGSTSLVTITGPPGTGKTRLAIEIADRLLGRFPDGAWFVPLAPVGDPRLVMSTIANVIGAVAPPGMSSVDAVSTHFRNRIGLLVLDNFEHLALAAVEVGDLMSATPGLRCIVTSRELLHLDGEREFALRPFEVPPAGLASTEYEGSVAIELFAQRARAARPDFHLGPDNAALIGTLCRKIEGLPLAIELAAARAKLFSIEAIADHLDHRLTLLGGGPSVPASHHESLRAAIAWSYDLLGASRQRAFRALSVFRGGWTVESAMVVAVRPTTDGDDPLDTLVALQDASLLVRQETAPSSLRFTMLETLREFAEEQLDQEGETDLVRHAHATHFLELVGRTVGEVPGPGQAGALDKLAAEHDNIRVGLRHLMSVSPVEALRMSAGMWRFWQMRGHLGEGSQWVEDALRAAGEDAPDLERAAASTAAGGLAYWRSDLAEAERHYDRAVDLRRRLGDEVPLADALLDLAFVFDPSLRPPPEDQDRTAIGVRLAEEAHDHFEHAGHGPGVARSEWLLGSLIASRELERAIGLLGSSVSRFREYGDPFGLGWALHSSGLALLRSGDAEAAGAAFGEALRLFAAAGDGSATALLLDDFAELAKAEGDSLLARRLQGAAAGMRHVSEAELVVANAPWLLDGPDPRGLIDAAALDQAWHAGRALSQAEAIELALDPGGARTTRMGLRVWILGSLAVTQAGEPVADWGGPKAGNRHALAIFAFLVDRADRGVTKDEFIEVLWPDAEVLQGDLNFHRTLGGLRTTLGRVCAAEPLPTVRFTNGRYRLAPAVLGWVDADAFEDHLLHAAEATDELLAIRGLEAARSLYRGDFLDDCPLYGDSEYVEERRKRHRGQIVDALVDLGRRYALRHDNSLASSRFREALTLAGGDCPSATEGLGRLGVAAD